MWRKQVIAGLMGVEREYRVAARAVALLQQGSESDPMLLRRAQITPADVRQCAAALETTYVVRLFAIFEEALREIWAVAWQRKTNPKTRDLLQGCASHQHVHDADRANADRVRLYRNSIVHGGLAEPMTLPQACTRLCRFFGWMPKTG